VHRPSAEGAQDEEIEGSRKQVWSVSHRLSM
jgi:hypothetical protein